MQEKLYKKLCSDDLMQRTIYRYLTTIAYIIRLF